MAAPGMFSQGFLSEKSIGGLPNWSLGVGVVALLVLVKTWQKNKATTIGGTGPATDRSTTPGTASNYVTPGTGSGAYNTGAPTVFVVPGATPSAPSQPPIIGRDPGPANTDYTDASTVLNTDVFNTNGWSETDKQAPWRMTMAKPGESWLDVTSRVYDFGPNYASTNDADKNRIQSVAAFLRSSNTGDNNSQGPKAGNIVVYR